VTNEEYEKWETNRRRSQASAQLIDGSLGAIGLGIRFVTVWGAAFILFFFGFLLAVIGILHLACLFIGA